MKTRVLLVIVTCLAIAGGAIAFMATRGGETGDPYLIGASFPLTKAGKPNAEGEAMRQALELFADRINQRGGIGGHPLALAFEDDQNDKQLARKNAEKFASNPAVLAVIGHQFSSVSIAARLRNSMVVGRMSVSPRLVTGNSSGKPPIS